MTLSDTKQKLSRELRCATKFRWRNVECLGCSSRWSRSMLANDGMQHSSHPRHQYDS